MSIYAATLAAEAVLEAEIEAWGGKLPPASYDDWRAEGYEHGPMRKPCGCPLDADCNGYHAGALDGWPP